jgi:hypothetical protein
MDWSRSSQSPQRDLVLFLCGPALVAVAIAVWFAVRPWPVPVADQAQHYMPGPVAISLGLGAIGAWLSSRVGLPSVPALTDGRRWLWLVLASTGLGLLIVAVSAVEDAMLGVQHFLAQRIGHPSMNVPFPASIPHYLCGSILQECLFRLGPVPILAWVIGKLAFRDGVKPQVFWTIAILLSLVEPVMEMVMTIHVRPDIALIGGGTGVVGNLVWVALYRKMGWPVLLITRIVLELGWHVAWPLIAG